MTKKNVALRVDPELKAQAATLFEELGLDLSTATEVFYRQALRCNGFPFEIKLYVPNDAAMAATEGIEGLRI